LFISNAVNTVRFSVAALISGMLSPRSCLGVDLCGLVASLFFRKTLLHV